MTFLRKFKEELVENLPSYAVCTLMCFFVLYGFCFTPWGQKITHDYERLIVWGVHYVCPDLVYVPRDLEDCFTELDRLLTDELQTRLKTGEVRTWQMHMTTGLWIRNNWGLWQGSRLSRYFNGLGVYHPDDISSIILYSYVRHLRDEYVDMSNQIKFYQMYWKFVRTLKEIQDKQVTAADENTDNDTGEDTESVDETEVEPSEDGADMVMQVLC